MRSWTSHLTSHQLRDHGQVTSFLTSSEILDKWSPHFSPAVRSWTSHLASLYLVLISKGKTLNWVKSFQRFCSFLFFLRETLSLRKSYMEVQFAKQIKALCLVRCHPMLCNKSQNFYSLIIQCSNSWLAFDFMVMQGPMFLLSCGLAVP